MTGVNVCNFLAEKLATRHPTDLSPAERAELNAHIASCLACATKQANYNMLTTRIRQLPAIVPLAATTHEFFWRDAASSQRVSVRSTRAFNGTVNPNEKTLSGSYLTNTGLTGTCSVHLL